METRRSHIRNQYRLSGTIKGSLTAETNSKEGFVLKGCEWDYIVQDREEKTTLINERAASHDR
jgi:hypothetical protein